MSCKPADTELYFQWVAAGIWRTPADRVAIMRDPVHLVSGQSVVATRKNSRRMTDTFTPEQRSRIMGRIRSVNTQPEMAVRRLLHNAGFRFRLHGKSLPGKPDIVLPRYKAAVFVHGCFWHGHDECRDGRRPKSNTDYWNRKLDRVRSRDVANLAALQAINWKPVVVWECEISDANALLHRLETQIRGEYESSH